jgi:hypothetical protein
LSLRFGLNAPLASRRTGVGVTRIFLAPGDHRLLITKHHLFLIAFGRAHLSDTNLFLQNEPSFDEQHFLDDGNDRGVAFLANFGNLFDPPADRDRFDLNALMRQVLVC